MIELAQNQKTATPHLSGIFEIADLYDAFILDLWGVVHNGARPYDGVIECMEELKARGKEVCLLSNSPNRSETVANMMAGFGVTRDKYTHILTSGELTNLLFERAEGPFAELEMKGAAYYDFWQETNATTLDGLGFTRVDRMEEAGFILAALLDNDRDDANALSHYEDDLARALDLDLTLVCANPDRKVHHGERLHLCPGSIAQRYEEIGGTVIWVGKPYPEIYRHAHKILGRPDRERILAVGDSISTDIHGANDFGVNSALNLIGLHWDEVTIDNKIDQATLGRLIDNAPYRPTYTLETFRW
ncbi:MAG: TIGR01459 family HAD-type hydrolase [Alphaproteobacteria bacterium]|nr:TIGR01459 family HAD-type hydrolase [Alphaproteobacteria bacterium]